MKGFYIASLRFDTLGGSCNGDLNNCDALTLFKRIVTINLKMSSQCSAINFWRIGRQGSILYPNFSYDFVMAIKNFMLMI